MSKICLNSRASSLFSSALSNISSSIQFKFFSRKFCYRDKFYSCLSAGPEDRLAPKAFSTAETGTCCQSPLFSTRSIWTHSGSGSKR